MVNERVEQMKRQQFISLDSQFIHKFEKFDILVKMPPKKEVLGIYSFGQEWNILILPFLDTIGYTLLKKYGVWFGHFFSGNRGYYSTTLFFTKPIRIAKSAWLAHSWAKHEPDRQHWDRDPDLYQKLRSRSRSLSPFEKWSSISIVALRSPIFLTIFSIIGRLWFF